MGKLIEQIQPGMTMEQVRKLIPYKPYSIIADSPMNQKDGLTKWVYLNSKGMLEIYFKDSIYTHHKITPSLAEIEKERMEKIKKAFPLYFKS